MGTSSSSRAVICNAVGAPTACGAPQGEETAGDGGGEWKRRKRFVLPALFPHLQICHKSPARDFNQLQLSKRLWQSWEVEGGGCFASLCTSVLMVSSGLCIAISVT